MTFFIKLQLIGFKLQFIIITIIIVLLFVMYEYTFKLQPFFVSLPLLYCIVNYRLDNTH